jgi:hypothetical protein
LRISETGLSGRIAVWILHFERQILHLRPLPGFPIEGTALIPMPGRDPG